MFAANAYVNARILGQRVANKNSRILNLCYGWIEIEDFIYHFAKKKCVLVCFLLLSNIIWRSKWHILNHLCFRSVRKAFWWEKNVSIYVEQQYNAMQYKSPLDCRKWLASHSQNQGGKLQNNSMEDQSHPDSATALLPAVLSLNSLWIHTCPKNEELPP